VATSNCGPLPAKPARARSLVLCALAGVILLGSSPLGMVGGHPAQPEFMDRTTSICINIPAARLTLRRHGEAVAHYPIGFGKPSTPTPTGQFSVAVVVREPTWYPKNREPVPPGPSNPLGPWWIGLSAAGYGIHGTNRPESIGHAVSDGCIRMHNKDVEQLVRHVGPGTPVHIIYDPIILDRAGQEISLRLYPDIYGISPLTVERVSSFMEDNGLVPAAGPGADSLFDLVARAATTPVQATVHALPDSACETPTGDQARSVIRVRTATGFLGCGFEAGEGVYVPLLPLLRVLGDEDQRQYAVSLGPDLPLVRANQAAGAPGPGEGPMVARLLAVPDAAALEEARSLARLFDLVGQSLGRDEAGRSIYWFDLAVVSWEGSLYSEAESIASFLDLNLRRKEEALIFDWSSLWCGPRFVTRDVHWDGPDLMVPVSQLAEAAQICALPGARDLQDCVEAGKVKCRRSEAGFSWVSLQEAAASLGWRVEQHGRRTIVRR